MSVKHPRTKLVLPTKRSPGSGNPDGQSFGQAIRPPSMEDVNTMNVPEYDRFTQGTPRPFVSVHKFDSHNVFGGKRVPKPVTGRS